VVPKTTMKALYWVRIQTTSGTANTPVIWDDIEDIDVPVDNLETMFSKVTVKAKVKEKTEPKTAATVNVAKIIEAKKSQNLGIFLKSKKLDVDIVREVLLECNSALELETLVALKGFQASPEEELVQLNHHMESKPDVPLDLADQFLWDLSQVHQVDARISCLIFQNNFRGRCEEIEFRVNNLKSCCQFLSTNPNLKKVLGFILACGNYLNGGNRQRGQADGFSIDILPKIKDVKSNDNFDNLLGFVVSLVIENYDDTGTPLAVLPVPEPSWLKMAQAVDIEAERAECKKLHEEVTRVKNFAFKIDQTAAAEFKEPFSSKMKNFVLKAEGEMKELQENLEDCSSKFVDCLKFYKFTPKKGKVEDAKPSDFFGAWYMFCEDFKNLWKKEEQKIEIQLQKEERRKLKEKKDVLQVQVV